MDWSLVRGKTKVMSQANAAVKTACPQSVFPSCSDSEEGARDVSLSGANGVTTALPHTYGNGRLQKWDF